MQPPKAFLFDLDGVLIDSEPLHGEAWKKTAQFFKANLTNAQLKLLRGRRRKDCAQKGLEWINKPIKLQKVLEVHKPISKNLLQDSPAMEGAEQLIQWCLTKKLPIALVTSSSSTSVETKTSPHPWLKSFSTRVLGDDPLVKNGKPSPEPYLLGAKKLSINPKYCWVLEDSLSGTQSALSAGCKVWVLESDKKKEIKAISNNFNYVDTNPTYIDHLNEVLNVLKRIY